MLTVFNFITLNGYFKGPGDDISWHDHGGEESSFAEEKLQSYNSILLFGRKTYEQMASYWPTPEAMTTFPEVADGMNNAEKIVFSTTLKEAEWNNTRIIGRNVINEVARLKEEGKNMTILGSGSIVSLFAEANLVDEYQLMVDPVALGNGTPIFSNIKRKLELELTETNVFKSGIVLLCYKPKDI